MRSRRVCCVVALLLCVAVAGPSGSQPELTPEARLAQARERFEGGDYEAALSLLDETIRTIGSPVEATRLSLITALQLRARVQFTLGNEPAAQEDFTRLLALDPEHALPVEVSPRIASLFLKVREASVGTVTLQVDPIDAVVEIDGRPAAKDTPIVLPVGEHTVSATRAGYQPYSAGFAVIGGSDERVIATLLRVSAVLSIITSPPGVEVLLNGAARAVTAAGPLPPQYADLPGRLAVSASEIAGPLVIPDLQPGTYTLQFRRPCYQTETLSLPIDQPRDYSLEPVVLKPAIATLKVETAENGAVVYLDGQPRGNAPLTIRDLCQGEHTIEVRSRSGRYVETVLAKPGGAISVTATLKPAIAMLPAAGLPEGYRGHDIRLDVLRALRSTRHLTFLAPSDPVLKPLLDADKLRDDALAFDMAKRPVGSAALMTAAVRREVVRRLSQELDVQGLASVTVAPGDRVGQRLTLSLFARGAWEPDVFVLELDQPSSVAAVLERLDLTPDFTMPVLGMLGIDVTGVDGVVIARVEEDGPARAAGLAPGERITQLLGEPTPNEAALTRVLQGRRSADSLPATIVGRDGTTRQVALRPAAAPRLVSVLDRTLPFNALAAQWRHVASGPSGPDTAMVRLNLAVAALRIGDFDGAREDLAEVKLGPGAGISEGTVQYLLGLAYKGLGDFARAREAWTRAASAERATLSEYGGSVPDLARQELQALGTTP